MMEIWSSAMLTFLVSASVTILITLALAFIVLACHTLHSYLNKRTRERIERNRNERQRSRFDDDALRQWNNSYNKYMDVDQIKPQTEDEKYLERIGL